MWEAALRRACWTGTASPSHDVCRHNPSLAGQRADQVCEPLLCRRHSRGWHSRSRSSWRSHRTGRGYGGWGGCRLRLPATAACLRSGGRPCADGCVWPAHNQPGRISRLRRRYCCCWHCCCQGGCLCAGNYNWPLLPCGWRPCHKAEIRCSCRQRLWRSSCCNAPAPRHCSGRDVHVPHHRLLHRAKWQHLSALQLARLHASTQVPIMWVISPGSQCCRQMRIMMACSCMLCPYTECIHLLLPVLRLCQPLDCLLVQRPRGPPPPAHAAPRLRRLGRCNGRRWLGWLCCGRCAWLCHRRGRSWTPLAACWGLRSSGLP